MRKLLIVPAIVLVAIAIHLLLRDDNGIVIIQDKYFTTQLEDIYLNAQTYAGKQIAIEGFTLLLDDGEFPGKFAVARLFIVCCGPGAPIGLPCSYSEATPQENDWIAVEGIIRVDTNDVVYIDVTKLTAKDNAGNRYVSSQSY